MLLTHAGRVLLVQRDRSQSVMPGMWELPERKVSTAESAPPHSSLTVRHAIMDTDYRVHVVRHDIMAADPASDPAPARGRWFHPQAAARLPLTGLARKILRRDGVLQRNRT